MKHPILDMLPDARRAFDEAERQKLTGCETTSERVIEKPASQHEEQR